MKKIIALLLYTGLFTVSFMHKEQVISWIKDDSVTFLPLMVLLSILLASIPIVPFTLFGALMGAKFGPMLGFFINWVGSISGAIIYYLLARNMFSAYAKTSIYRIKNIDIFIKTIKENAFLSIVLARIVPLVPPPIVNIYCGSMRIYFPIYLAATCIGKIPSSFLLAYGGNQLFQSLQSFILVLLLYALFVIIILITYRLWIKREIA